MAHLTALKEESRARTDGLVDRARRGDAGAFGELVRCHEGWVRGYLRARIRDWASCDDLAQDVFVTAFRGLRKFRGDSSFESWLRGIAMNHLRNHIRKRKEDLVGGTEELQLLVDQGCEAWEGDGGGRLEALTECLGRLDGPASDLLKERYVMGKTVREIASETGRGYSALTMQLHRMREVLAECIRLKEQSS